MKRFFIVTMVLVMATAAVFAEGGRETGDTTGPRGRMEDRGSSVAVGRRAGGQGAQAEEGRFTESVADMLEEIEPAELSESEAEGLVFMLEEEKLARDVYAALYEITYVHFPRNSNG